MLCYVDWMENGYLSSTGRCFDIGTTTAAALHSFQQSGEPFSGSTDPRAAGNGSIMRLAPVPIFYFPDLAKVIHYSAESSRTTHGSVECVDSCRLFAAILYKAFYGQSKAQILFGAHFPTLSDVKLAPKVQALANGDYRDKSEDQIFGSGYVINSLEAALWCFWQTSTYREAVLRAANLGDDADTTAAVCGQIAGAFYGVEGIPPEWLEKVTMRSEIIELVERLRLKRK